MKACPACRRHVFAREARCPFCEGALAEASAPSRGAVLGLAAALAACGPRVADDADGDDGTTSGGEATPPDGSVEPPDPDPTTTTPATTAVPSTSATVATAGDDESGSSTTDDPSASGFIYGSGPDSGTLPECSTRDQDCPPGEKCMPWANDGGDVWNATRCSPVDPMPADFGEDCFVEGSAVSGVDSCAEGLMCFNVDAESNHGTCFELCAAVKVSCAAALTECATLFDDGLEICLNPCPAPTPCPPGFTCTADDNGSPVCYPD